MGAFTGVSKIILDYSAAAQTITLNTTLFSFSPTVAITTSAGAASNDSLIKMGAVASADTLGNQHLSGLDDYQRRRFKHRQRRWGWERRMSS